MSITVEVNYCLEHTYSVMGGIKQFLAQALKENGSYNFGYESHLLEMVASISSAVG